MSNIRIAFLVVLAVASLQLGALPTPTASALTNCTVGNLGIDSEEQAFLGLINNHRPPGIPDLQMSVELNRASSWMAADMASVGYMSHTDSLGRDSWTRMANCDVPVGNWAENIASWYITAADVFEGWKNSPGHNQNMLSGAYNYIGIARAAGGPAGWYWATNFSSTGTPLGGAGGGAPLAPSNVSIQAPSASSLTVYFNDNEPNDYGIDIERRTAAGTWALVKTTTPLSGTQAGWYWPDSGLASGTQYCYRLRARGASQFSAYSAEACGTTTAAGPAAPTGVSVQQPTGYSLNVWFNDNEPNDSGIDIERRTAGGTWSLIKTTSPLSGTQAGWYWPDQGLQGATQYCYRLRARVGTQFSPYSAEACGTTTASGPAAPSNVSVQQPTGYSLNVWFNDNEPNDNGIDIERRPPGGTWALIKTTSPLSGTQTGWYWPDQGLQGGTQYCYRLRARVGNQFSSYSAEACGTTTVSGPLAPSNVSVQQPMATSLNVWFNDNEPNDNGIDIERRPPGGTWALIKTTSPLQGTQSGWYWPDQGLQSGTQYCYRLRARVGTQFSSYSSEVCGTTTGSAPAALGTPTGVSIQQPTSYSLNVWFNDNATGETGIDIERRVGTTGNNWTVVKTTSPLSGTQAGWYWPDQSLQANTQYCYRLRARNGAGAGSYSSIACGATTQ